MNDNKSYSGIDHFRFIAAFLIIAIHTSPLLSYTETGDFIFTRIIARVAVPFFFMTSGFFLISRYRYNDDKLWSFVKKTALIYAVAVLIYIPINVYSGYFNTDHLLPNIIKDIFFDGTMYHLWYLPASIIGAVIAWFTVKRVRLKKALLITLLLYAIGLFGDSYYGISNNIPLLKGMYGYIFDVSDYTRNGIFFAPIFFVIGGIIADKSIRLSLKNSIIGFGVSFALMLFEGILLHSFNIQRHDSMYIMLLPCMFFLFNALSYWRGKRSLWLRTSALIIYIVHPMIIVFIRMIAKFTHTEKIIVDNSAVFYILVSAASAAFAIILTKLYYKYYGKKVRSVDIAKERAYIEIDLKNLEHNVRKLKNAMPQNCNIMAVVKAEAYGHGAYEVTTFINKQGVKAFAVATIDEGIKLRKYGIDGEILILGFTDPNRAKELYKYDLTQTLVDIEYAQRLNSEEYKIKAHIKIDTGMHRLGFDSDNREEVAKAFSMKNIKICGIYTHLCVSDSLSPQDVYFTKQQIQRFYDLLKSLKAQGIKIPKTHIQSSYGFLNYPEVKCNYVRTGVALYGVLSSPSDKTRQQLDLRPVLSLKSRVILIRDIKRGESIGYGRDFIANRDSKMAVVSIGFADGVPRNLSFKKAYVLIRGKKAPIIGRICMDVLTIDVTDINDVSVGDTVTLIGKDGVEEISAAAEANLSGSISNELLSRMGTRLKIVTKQ